MLGRKMSAVGGKAVSTEMVLYSLNSTCYLESQSCSQLLMNIAALTIPSSYWGETTRLKFLCSPSVLQGKVLDFVVVVVLITVLRVELPAHLVTSPFPCREKHSSP